jgi:hypothetical protein
MSLLKNCLIEELLTLLNPADYIREIWSEPYSWQTDALDPKVKRLLLMCARQSGKSTVSSGLGGHTAKNIDRSLTLIISPSQDQSKETMKKVDDFLAADSAIRLVKSSAFEKELENGSRIIALPGTERSVRGYSGPFLIIVDEASRVLDSTYKAVRPMLTGNPDAKLIILSTPFGKRGFFYDAWMSKAGFWKKIFVKPAYRLSDDQKEIIPAVPEEEFQAYWQERGVSAYYSPRHEKSWLEEELEEMGAWWFQQEYMCEFLEAEGSVFDFERILNSVSEDLAPLLLGDDESMMSDELEELDL